LNTNGELIVSCQYERCADFHEGFAVVKNGDQYAMIDINGKYYIPFGIYDYISDFSEGLAEVDKRGMSGFVDKNGNSTFDYIK
jgi:serine/threonine-protein kinase